MTTSTSNTEPSRLSKSKTDQPAKVKRTLLQKMAIRSFFAVCMAVGLATVYYCGHKYLCGFVVAVQVGAYYELTKVQHNFNQEENEKGGPKLFRSMRFAWLALALYHAYGMSWLLAPFETGTTLLDTVSRWVSHFVKALVQFFPSLPDFSSTYTDEFYLLFALYYCTYRSAMLLSLPGNPEHYHDLVSLGLFAIVFMLTVFSFEKGRYREQLLNISWTLSSLLIVVFQMKSAIKNLHNGVFWFVVAKLICVKRVFDITTVSNVSDLPNQFFASIFSCIC